MQTAIEVGKNALDGVVGQEESHDGRDFWLKQDIEDLDLPKTVLNCLGHNDVRIIADVVYMTEATLMNKLAKFKGSTRDRYLAQMKELLAVKGLTIGMRRPSTLSG